MSSAIENLPTVIYDKISELLHFSDKESFLKAMEFEREYYITDVSALGNVHTLKLSECQGIRDVSALGGVHTHNLSNCNGITDVSALGGVHTLNLFGWDKITDVSALGGVKKLTM